MIRTASSILGAVSILAVVGAPTGCSSAGSSATATNKAPAHTAGQTVTSTLRVIGNIHAQITAASVIGVVGSYHGCLGQTDGTSWVLDTAGNAGVLEGKTGFAAPSVELNDTGCALQIDSIDSSTVTYGSTNQPTSLVFTGASATPNAYLASGVGFDDPTASNDLSFYANAQSTITSASGDFALTLLVGNDPNIGSSSTTAAPAVVSGTVSSVADVPAPDYSTDFSTLTLQDDVNGVVATISGTVNLVSGTVAGEEYMTFQGQDLSTFAFAQIDGMWNATGAIATGGGNVAVAATSLVSVGDPLPETSSIVVQHIDSAGNVTTYQVLAVTFNPHGGGP